MTAVPFQSTLIAPFGQSASIFPPPGEWSGTSVTELQAAVVISLYTDRRVEQHELPEGDRDRRGWWGDTFELVPFGSRLWLTERGKITSDDPVNPPPGVFTLARVEALIREALQWLIDDGVVSSIDVVIERRENSGSGAGVAAEITLNRDRGGPVVARFDPLWEALRNA